MSLLALWTAGLHPIFSSMFWKTESLDMYAAIRCQRDAGTFFFFHCLLLDHYGQTENESSTHGSSDSIRWLIPQEICEVILFLIPLVWFSSVVGLDSPCDTVWFRHFPHYGIRLKRPFQGEIEIKLSKPKKLGQNTDIIRV
jgi:hypothetical protein